MSSIHWPDRAGSYMRKLCIEIPSRRVGSQGNRAATDFFTERMESFGFQTESPAFECMDWSQAGTQVSVGEVPFEAFASPYTTGCQASAPLKVASNAAELEGAELTQTVLLLRGDLAKEPLMPKNFPFYNPEEHKHILQLLEVKKPLAILAATSRNEEMAGAMYPFPLIEDGDFDIPSVFMTEEEGDRLAEMAGQEVSVVIQARRIPARGCNVIARKVADPACRVVLFAHIDAKYGTPGAIDNATGTVVLLLLAELLADYTGRLGVEIVALNGEDYYSNPGEQLYLEMNAGRFGEILLGINLDGVGYMYGKTAYSLYGCPPPLAGLIRNVFSAHQDLVEGEPWVQGDHGLFVMNQRPALALTSERVFEIMAEIVHTSKDTPEIVASAQLSASALALRDLILQLELFAE